MILQNNQLAKIANSARKYLIQSIRSQLQGLEKVVKNKQKD